MALSPSTNGIEIIKGFVRNLPNGPGVYRMFDEASTVIYVGKARNLKSRVTNYTSYEGNSTRICRMISATRSMEFVTTETESAALLLEANMIKRLRPRFNVLLRDDKSFPYILITGDHEAPMLMKHRGSRRQKGDYFGPFASANAVNRTVASLQKAFLLRNCSDSFYAGRTRPCLQYQIKRCAAPCTRMISIDAYGQLVQEAKDFLGGKSKAVQTQLQAEMNIASDTMEFEQAAKLRDRISALSQIQGGGSANAQAVEEADVFAIHQEAGNFCVQVFFYRAFQNWGNHAFYPRADETQSLSEVLEAFIAQFYDSRQPAKLLLISEDLSETELLRDALSEHAGQRIQIETPKRGEKRGLVEQAITNAREALGRQLSDTASQKKLLEGMRETFGLAEAPKRIEVYDNSHIQGTNAIGAMIVAGPEGFSKKHYRTFNIKSKEITPGDDFGMMREVLTRRFTRLANERPEATDGELNGEMPDWPDVLLIDGGLGQVNAVKTVLKALSLPREVTIIGIAKGEERNAGRETFFAEGREPFMLPARDPVLYYTQRLRDEAHRFAIGTHRAKRSKEIVKNPLDEIGGIGPTRKRALLQHFGSAKAISRAALSDIASIPGISAKIAQDIFDFFRKS